MIPSNFKLLQVSQHSLNSLGQAVPWVQGCHRDEIEKANLPTAPELGAGSAGLQSVNPLY